MKILWVTLRDYSAYGGAEKLFYEFMKRLSQDGHRITAISTDILSSNTIATNRGKRITFCKETRNGIHFRRFRTIRFIYDKNLAFWLGKFGNNFFQGVFGIPFIWIPGFVWYAYTTREKFDLVIAGPHPYYAVIYPAFSFAKRKKYHLLITL